MRANVGAPAPEADPLESLLCTAEPPVPGEEAPGAEASLLSPRGQQLFRNLKENGLAAMEIHLTIYCLETLSRAGDAPTRRPWSPLRIARRDFDYSCLGEQRQPHSIDNILILLEEVLAYLPWAWNRETAARFLASLDPGVILQSKGEEVENYDRWMLEWVRIEGEERMRKGTAP
jgi:hypothetical protein